MGQGALQAVRNGGKDRPKAYFQAQDYVLLKHQTNSTLDALVIPHVPRVVETRPMGNSGAGR